MLRLLFNYYIVLKNCWVILLFQLIGWIGLVVMEQGNDILRALSFTAEPPIRYHAWYSLIAVMWWSWQSWRSSRVELHFTTFDFVQFSKRYALQAQVMIPRVLGLMPIIIFMAGLLKATGWHNPMVYLYLCLGIWLFIFFYMRKQIIVFFMSRNPLKFMNIPDYVLIKNEAYPALFIWKKQGPWILFRLICIFTLFTLVVLYPVHFPQKLGSSAIILFALGSWQVIGTFIDFAEKHFSFPFTFTIIVMVMVFSFFNNNHKIRTVEDAPQHRKSIENHFLSWYENQTPCMNDSVPVVLVAAQGGGVRASYWTAQVLAEMQAYHPSFDKSVYAYSAVSGGSLGVATYKSLVKNQEDSIPQKAHDILSQDFLSPVSSWLVFPDLVQKFLPFPVYRVDRARALEYSWEEAARSVEGDVFAKGFLASTVDDPCLYFYNSTKSENGLITLISNVRAEKEIFPLKEDLFSVMDQDIPYSTAISLSSRFPFLTPPGLVFDRDGNKWGHLVDGGYVENMGASTMFELYNYLKEISRHRNLKTKFIMVFIRNTKDEYTTEINGMHEIIAPINTFSKVWVNSGNYSSKNTKINNLPASDDAVFINLDRPDGELIPLGWYLSPQAISSMDGQLEKQTAHFKEVMDRCFQLK
ncbi:patatin-like phospholipase family protein [bacterium]|nr:patatin-like phospholipase family protein [bacterium]